MSNPEGIAPNSVEALAIKELQEQGEVLEVSQVETPKEEPKSEPKDEPKEVAPAPKEEPKKEQPSRTPSMVEAWKLKVAEDQSSKKIAELESKIEELSKQKSEPTQIQKEEISDDIDAILKEAEEAGSDVNWLKKFSNALLAKAKPSSEIAQTVAELKEQKLLAEQMSVYNNEFDADVLPLVKEYNLSDNALSELKKSLKEVAFSETYAKVPLKEIFLIKKDTFELQAPKRSGEGKGVKVRANEVVDLDNLDEDSFKKLSEAQILELASRNSSGWK